MALPASGTIKLSDVAAEFGGSLPHAMSEYYRGGSYVPNFSANSSVPTSGSISLSNFYSSYASYVGNNQITIGQDTNPPGYGYTCDSSIFGNTFGSVLLASLPNIASRFHFYWAPLSGYSQLMIIATSGTPFSGSTKTNLITNITVGSTTVTTASADSFGNGSGTYANWSWIGDVFGFVAKNGTTVAFVAEPA